VNFYFQRELPDDLCARTASKWVRTRKFKTTINSDHSFNIAASLVQQDFTTSGPNQTWTDATTCVLTREGLIYLAVILGFLSRQVIGWAISNRIK
jgi:putative transposase